MQAVVVVEEISKHFYKLKSLRDVFVDPLKREKVVALDGVSFSVPAGQLFGMLGPNGAGKTTLIKILTNLIVPSSGRAFVKGFDITRQVTAAKQATGYVMSEERSFYWRMTGRQNLAFFAALYNISRRDEEQRVEQLLEMLDLSYAADQMFMTYSTGMKQKLAIARGLLSDPDLIFMDEPTKSLDPETALRLMEFVRDDLVRKQGKTVILATHLLPEAETYCDRVAIMDRSQIKACGTLPELRGILRKRYKFVLKVQGAKDDWLLRCEGEKAILESAWKDGPDRHELIIYVENTDDMAGILESFIKFGGKVYACEEREMNLAEIFGKITGRRMTTDSEGTD